MQEIKKSLKHFHKRAKISKIS